MVYAIAKQFSIPLIAGFPVSVVKVFQIDSDGASGSFAHGLTAVDTVLGGSLDPDTTFTVNGANIDVAGAGATGETMLVLVAGR